MILKEKEFYTKAEQKRIDIFEDIYTQVSINKTNRSYFHFYHFLRPCCRIAVMQQIINTEC